MSSLGEESAHNLLFHLAPLKKVWINMSFRPIDLLNLTTTDLFGLKIKEQKTKKRLRYVWDMDMEGGVGTRRYPSTYLIYLSTYIYPSFLLIKSTWKAKKTHTKSSKHEPHHKSYLSIHGRRKQILALFDKKTSFILRPAMPFTWNRLLWPIAHWVEFHR